jgi:death-on-curing protein
VNGFDFLARDAECVIKTLELAAGELSEAQLASWIRTHMQTKSTHAS